MRNYNPLMGYLSIFMAIINSLTMPGFGFLLGNLMFVIIAGPKSPTFQADRDYWIIFGIGLMLVAASVGYIQKLLFSLAGEGLTISVRNDLVQIIGKVLPNLPSTNLAKKLTNYHKVSTAGNAHLKLLARCQR